MSISKWTDINSSKLESLIADLLSKYNTPGCSVAIRNGDEIIPITVGFAYDNMPMNTETYCYGASLTKQIFAFVTLKLVELDIIKSDIPLLEQVELPYYDHLPSAKQITLEHVLSHTSGFPNWAWNRELTHEFTPGSQFQYSGEGFILLQRAIELLTNKSWWELLQEYLIRPAGLSRIALSKDDLLDNNHTEGHDEEGKLYIRPNYQIDDTTKARIDIKYNAAGSIWVTPTDYAKALYHIEKNEPKIWQKMITSRIEHEPWKMSWGLGIGGQITDLGKACWQWGSENDYKAFTITYLDHDYAIHIFTNGANGKKVYSDIIEKLTCEVPNFVKYSSFS